MPIETKRLEEGLIYTISKGRPSFGELNGSRDEGIRMLAEAGDKVWVLIMDVAAAGIPRADMNSDTLRNVTKQNQMDDLAGYVVIGANPGVRVLMSTYGRMFKIAMHFEPTLEAALPVARTMRDNAKNKVKATPAPTNN